MQIKTLPYSQKNFRRDGFTGELPKAFKENIMHKILQKIDKKGILPSSLYKANVTLIQRQKRYYQKKGRLWAIFLMNTHTAFLNKF